MSITCRRSARRSPRSPASAACSCGGADPIALALGLALCARSGRSTSPARRSAGSRPGSASRRRRAGGRRRRCGAASGRRPRSAAWRCWSCRLAWALSPIFCAGQSHPALGQPGRWLGLNDGRGPLLSRNYAALSDDPKLLAVPDGQSRQCPLPRGRAHHAARGAADHAHRTARAGVRRLLRQRADPVARCLRRDGPARRGPLRAAVRRPRPRQSDFTRWVRENGKPVDDSQWRSFVEGSGRRAIELYDVKPD